MISLYTCSSTYLNALSGVFLSYLLIHRQGCYNKPGSIVILAAYLGQIPKLRQKLEDIVTIVIDERDAELLEQQTIDQEETATVQQVQLSQQVIIRLVIKNPARSTLYSY